MRSVLKRGAVCAFGAGGDSVPATEEGGGPNCGKRRSMRRRKDKGKRDGGRSGARGGVRQKREHGKEEKSAEG